MGTARSPVVDSIREDIVRTLAVGNIREDIDHIVRPIGPRDHSPVGSTEEDNLADGIRPRHTAAVGPACTCDIAVALVDIEGIAGARKQF